MVTYQAVIVVLGLFLLRFTVPLLVITVASYVMNRICAHWEAEEATAAWG